MLDGRVALVTGANHGIGAATAIELARLGAHLAVTYLRFEPEEDDPGRPAAYRTAREQDAAEVVAAVEALGRRCSAIEADLSDPATPTRVLDEAESALGPVTIVVHNASAWKKDTFGHPEADRFGRTLGAVTAATVDPQFAVDARAGALLIAELAVRLRTRGEQWGRIVTLTSGGPHGFPGEVSYGAAKAALENYTMSASVELADLGVTANVVYPPVTDTGWVTDEVRQFVAASPDHVHVAEPADVASVIGWLCTDAARLVTGNVIRLR